MNILRGSMTQGELRNPGYEFSIRPLELSNLPDNTYGIEIRGAANRARPGFVDFNFKVMTHGLPTVIMEVLVSDDGNETHEVYQNGVLLYRGCREEATGDLYELGGPNVEYVYFPKPEGMRDAFVKALDAAGVVHKLQPL